MLPLHGGIVLRRRTGTRRALLDASARVVLWSRQCKGRRGPVPGRLVLHWRISARAAVLDARSWFVLWPCERGRCGDSMPSGLILQWRSSTRGAVQRRRRLVLSRVLRHKWGSVPCRIILRRRAGAACRVQLRRRVLLRSDSVDGMRVHIGDVPAVRCRKCVYRRRRATGSMRAGHVQRGSWRQCLRCVRGRHGY
jgi:hypothetical protein